jgi:CSLREA domain-containing protein
MPKRAHVLLEFGIDVICALTLSTAADAATIVVNSLADPGSTGVCALRDAITAANTRKATNRCAGGSGNDSIRFTITGTIVLHSTFASG